MTDQFNNGGNTPPEHTKPQPTQPEITKPEDVQSPSAAPVNSGEETARPEDTAENTPWNSYASPPSSPVPPQQPYEQQPYEQQRQPGEPPPAYGQAPYGQTPYGQTPYGQTQNTQNQWANAAPPQNPQYAPYQNNPYYPPYAPRKQKMSPGLKVFIFIASFLAVGAVAGFIIFSVYTGITNHSYNQSSYNSTDFDKFLEEFEKKYRDNYGDYDYYGDYSGGEEQDPGNGLPPTTEEPKTDNPIVQPDIDIPPFNGTGITIQPKPTGAELSAQQVYDKVVPSTVGIVATILLSDGSTTQSGGTGMFISSDGYILTNSHVVGNTKSSGVTITTHDGQEYPAVIVSFDKTTDLAVLKTEDHGFTPVEFGSADDLSIGEWVMVIGNPGGATFSGSLTRGVISGLDREVGDYSSNGMTYIQTDAAINPGNSGGPLVNMYGQVVGISSSKIIAQYYEGMGFAIPVSGAKTIIDQLLTSGYVSGRTRLGITGQNMVYELPAGVRIVNIESESSFTGTEAQNEDVITAVDGTDISSLTELANLLLDHSPGDRVEVTLYRPSTEETFTVTATLLEDKGETQK